MKLFSSDADAPPAVRRQWLAELPAAVRWGALAALLLSLVLLGWLGVQAVSAKSQLEQARISVQHMKEAFLNGKSEDAVRQAENAQSHARQARAATRSLPWTIAAAIPLLGSPLKTTQQIAEVVVGLADDVLLPAAGMGGDVSPGKLIEGTRINLALLRSEEPRLSALSGAAADIDARAQAISRPGYLPMISEARTQLQDQTSRLAKLLGNAVIAAKLAAPMLGADGPRTYLMAFQTPAEARGTGGLVGAFGILRFDNGTPTVETLGTNWELGQEPANIDLGPQFNKTYGWMNPYADLRNSNVSPHFPYAAQIWKSMWERQSGGRIDGVITVDPVALSYILGAIGPVKLPDGEVISGDGIVEQTMSTSYVRFPTDFSTPTTISLTSRARKKYLLDIANAVVAKMKDPLPQPQALLDAIGKAAGEGRISVWSASRAEQELLEETPIAGMIPDDDAPYAQVVINNLAGNKMDYYLKRQIEYAADGCDGDVRNSTVTVRLTNTADADKLAPGSYSGTMGLAGGIPLNVPDGSMVSSVRLIATKGARLLSVSVNGERTRAVEGVDNGHPSFEVQVAIPPGQGGELTFRLSEPTSPGEPRMAIQPLVDNPRPKVAVPACSG